MLGKKEKKKKTFVVRVIIQVVVSILERKYGQVYTGYPIGAQHRIDKLVFVVNIDRFLGAYPWLFAFHIEIGKKSGFS